ncbi:MAG: ATP synthase subunit I [Myxococcales bacterium]
MSQPTTHDDDAKLPEEGMDGRLRVAMGSVAVAGGVLAVVGVLEWGAHVGFSVAVGAGLATGNLWVLSRIVSTLLPRESSEVQAGAARMWGVVALVKMAALFGGVWLLMGHGLVSPLALTVGFGALPIGIAIGSLVSDRSAAPRQSRTKDLLSPRPQGSGESDQSHQSDQSDQLD